MNNQSPKPSAKKNYLRIILFVVLAYLVVALLYDLFIVRPGMKQMQVDLEAEVEKQNNAPEEKVIFGPTDVRKKLGREPVGDMQEYNGYMFEEYAIPTALPGRTHSFIAIYRKSKSATPRLESVALFTTGQAGIDGLHEAPDTTVDVTVPTAPLETGDEGKAGETKPADKSKSGEEGSGEKDAPNDPPAKPSPDDKPADKPAATDDKAAEKDYKPDPAPKAESAPADAAPKTDGEK